MRDIPAAAQKREKNLHPTPVAVMALTTDMVDRARITNATSLTALVPHLGTTMATGGNSIPLMNIRRLSGSREAKINSNALFAQLTWHLTDALDATGGARSTSDYKRILEFEVLYPSCTMNRIDCLANTAYTFRLGLLACGKVGTGCQSGGVTNGVACDPEPVSAYEVECKGNFLDRRLRLNAAAFYTD